MSLFCSQDEHGAGCLLSLSSVAAKSFFVAAKSIAVKEARCHTVKECVNAEREKNKQKKVAHRNEAKRKTSQWMKLEQFKYISA